MAKQNIVPPSLQPRKVDKKPIPQAFAPTVEAEAPPPTLSQQREAEPPKLEKKRFTLWLPTDVFRAFKVHTAGNDSSASAYIEDLIRRDLNL